MISQYESERQKEKNEKREADGKLGIEDLKMREFTVNSDGSVVFFGEQYMVRNEMDWQGNSKTVYYYQDMVLTKIDKEGKVLWMKKLPKMQYGYAGRNEMGVSYSYSNGFHYIMYLDNKKNAELSLDKAPAKHKDGMGGFLTAYVVSDASGAVEKHLIFDTDDLKGKPVYQFKTSRILAGQDGTQYIEVYLKGKKDGLIKLEIQK